VEYIRTYASPQLRDPALIAAFAGWNDASEVATFAARFLVEQWHVRKMAEIDPEEFYVFTETRPHIRVPGRFQRHIEWPANEFFYHTDQRSRRDVVVLIGVEPDLKWRTFAEVVTSYCRQHGISTVVTLGALIADVPHTFPVELNGTATPAGLARRLRRLGVRTSRYSGPTGITGVLNATCARRRLATASIWGSVPEYLSATPNPKVALAMLDRLNALLDLDVDLAELRLLEAQFDRQVSDIVAEDPELHAYVRQLEEQLQAEGREVEEAPQAGHEPLPSSEDLIRELEEYLRRRRQGGS
jgi:proteasome assembly chaperone (PAC2) family protein